MIQGHKEKQKKQRENPKAFGLRHTPWRCQAGQADTGVGAKWHKKALTCVQASRAMRHFQK